MNPHQRRDDGPTVPLFTPLGKEMERNGGLGLKSPQTFHRIVPERDKKKAIARNGLDDDRSVRSTFRSSGTVVWNGWVQPFHKWNGLAQSSGSQNG
jgi:hypothetical protein